jgi:hypothetical protein
MVSVRKIHLFVPGPFPIPNRLLRGENRRVKSVRIPRLPACCTRTKSLFRVPSPVWQARSQQNKRDVHRRVPNPDVSCLRADKWTVTPETNVSYRGSNKKKEESSSRKEILVHGTVSRYISSSTHYSIMRKTARSERPSEAVPVYGREKRQVARKGQKKTSARHREDGAVIGENSQGDMRSGRMGLERSKHAAILVHA